MGYLSVGSTFLVFCSLTAVVAPGFGLRALSGFTKLPLFQTVTHRLPCRELLCGASEQHQQESKV